MIDADASQFAFPDFATLFADDAAANADYKWKLTPRTAYALWEAADNLADLAWEELDHLGDTPIDPEPDQYVSVFGRYPKLVWGEDRLWREHAVAAFEDLRDALGAGERVLPRTPAEEMALWAIVEDTRIRAELDLDRMEDLPTHRDDLSDDMEEYLFHDHDILLLFNQLMPGVEDPDDPMHDVVPDIADYRPEAWFDTFWNDPPRHPDRASYRKQKQGPSHG